MNNNLFAEYDYKKIYNCRKYTKCNHFSKLMYLIINSNIINYDDMVDYINKNKEEINDQNAEGWSALMIAVMNYNIYNNIKIIKLLLENGADINKADDD